MNLRLECSIYGSKKPRRESRGSGAPEFFIPKVVLEGHLEEGFTIEQIASILSVFERTVFRRTQRSSSINFSDISDDELDNHTAELSKEFP